MLTQLVLGWTALLSTLQPAAPSITTSKYKKNWGNQVVGPCTACHEHLTLQQCMCLGDCFLHRPKRQLLSYAPCPTTPVWCLRGCFSLSHLKFGAVLMVTLQFQRSHYVCLSVGFPSSRGSRWSARKCELFIPPPLPPPLFPPIKRKAELMVMSFLSLSHNHTHKSTLLY